nr:DUF927 domain-containing protein [uncultured Cohaesibacter sp.]
MKNDQVKNQQNLSEQQEEPCQELMTYPYRLNDGKIERCIKKDGVYKWVAIFSEVEVLALVRNESSNEWSYLVSVKDRDDKRHHELVRAADLHGTQTNNAEIRSKLASLGLRFFDLKLGYISLMSFIGQSLTDKRLTLVTKTGWHSSGSFVTPDWDIQGDLKTDLYYGKENCDDLSLFETKGSVESWQQEIAHLVQGNEMLVFAICLGLAPVLLEPLNADGFGVHLWGPSSCGKTTALYLGASIWGSPANYIQNWNLTTTAIEGTATRHNHTLLCLDEVGQAASDDANNAAYMLANGQGKGRGTVKGGVRERSTWLLALLSSGEVPFDKHVGSSNGREAKAGQKTRIINMPADGGADMGILTHLPNCFESSGEFVNALKKAACANHGTASKFFVEYLISLGRANVVEEASRIRNEFVHDNCDQKSDGQVKRVANHFGLIAAAGELGISAGLLPWPSNSAITSTKFAFKQWLTQRGGTGADEIIQGIKKIAAFLQKHGEARFTDMEKRERSWVISPADDNERKPLPTRDAAGYRLLNEKNEWDYLIYPEAFENEVCRGLDKKLIAKEMANRGWLKTGGNGKLSCSHRLPNSDIQRVYYVRSIFLSSVDE